MTTRLQQARQELDAHKMAEKLLITEIKDLMPHLNTEHIEDVLAALWLLKIPLEKQAEEG